jgi:hypothetical protein
MKNRYSEIMMTIIIMFILCANTVFAQAPPPALELVTGNIKSELAKLDKALHITSIKLSTAGITGTDAGKILLDLHEQFKYDVDVSTIDTKGMIKEVKPRAYTVHKGKDIKTQEQIKTVIKTKKPVISRLFKAVEGFEAIDFEYPVFNRNMNYIGSVSLLIDPDTFFGKCINSAIEGVPVDCWVMQTDGTVLYDIDNEEIGRNILNDKLYKPFPSAVSAAKKIAASDSGYTTYEFKGNKMEDVVTKEAWWKTIKFHNATWRVVLVKVKTGNEAFSKRTASQLGLKTTEDNLISLSKDENFAKAVEKGDRKAIKKYFTDFYDNNPDIYSIQYINDDYINVMGYPESNSLKNYDISNRETRSDTKTYDVVRSRKTESFDVPLLEGRWGRIFMVPVYSGRDWAGAVYFIKIIPGK